MKRYWLLNLNERQAKSLIIAIKSYFRLHIMEVCFDPLDNTLKITKTGGRITEEILKEITSFINGFMAGKGLTK